MVKNNVGKSQAIPYLLMQTIIPMITASFFKNLEEMFKFCKERNEINLWDQYDLQSNVPSLRAYNDNDRKYVSLMNTI